MVISFPGDDISTFICIFHYSMLKVTSFLA
jgi:hypothetical protein